MAFTTVDWGLCVVTTIATILFVALRKHTRTPYPPGPKGLPLLGCVFAVPQKRQWLTYQKWSEELSKWQLYLKRTGLSLILFADSPIIHFKLLGTSIIVLNDADTAHDLFDKRAEIYSERLVVTEICNMPAYSRSFSIRPRLAFVNEG